MVYTRKTSALLLIGIIMMAIWWLTSSGVLSPLIEHLGTQKKYGSEMQVLPLYFGVISIVLGFWVLFGNHKEGQTDYYLGTVAGCMFILLITMLVRWFIAPEIAVLGSGIGKVGSTGKYIHELLGLNYVVIGIVVGIIIVNVFKVPLWAQHGVRLSRLGLKTGVILLGTLYSLAELKQLGKLSVVLIGVFVLGSVGMVLWLSKIRKVSHSMGGVLSAGIGVCGLSAYYRSLVGYMVCKTGKNNARRKSGSGCDRKVSSVRAGLHLDVCTFFRRNLCASTALQGKVF